MGKIVALGGGSFETGEMDGVAEKIMALSGKEHPSMLFIPTASYDFFTRDDETLVKFESLGCKSDILFLTREETTQEVIKKKTDACDIIYASGGNLKFLMDTWKRTGVIRHILRVYNDGKVLSGLSSGAMCWFSEGYDDCGENGSFMFVEALGLIPYINCPHYQSENWQTFGQAIKSRRRSGIACDNGAALCFIDGKYSVLSGNEGGECYLYDAENNFEKHRLSGNEELLSRL